MQFLRLLLIVVLAVLLPLRGAVASALSCPAGTHGAASLHAAQGLAHHHGEGEPRQATRDHASGSHHDHESSAQEPGCGHACAAACCTAALWSELPVRVALPQTGPVTFPALSAPAPDFHSGRQERPPRSR